MKRCVPERSQSLRHPLRSREDALICKTQLWGIGVLRADRAPLNTHVPVNGSCPEVLIMWVPITPASIRGCKCGYLLAV